MIVFGIYVFFVKRNLFKFVLVFNIIDVGIYLFFISFGYRMEFNEVLIVLIYIGYEMFKSLMVGLLL